MPIVERFKVRLDVPCIIVHNEDSGIYFAKPCFPPALMRKCYSSESAEEVRRYLIYFLEKGLNECE